ncbi:MAG: lamin tail domain-containing protein [Phycisphaerae bacterium]|nr:lamin tail domain-containing protein [Phycisphaerae bacterium]
MKRSVAIVLVAAVVQAAFGSMQISEWMYSGTSGEFIEFTNIGPAAVDMTGWSYDDDSQMPGTVDLSAFGVVAPGASVLLVDVTAADFATAWALSGVGIIGDNLANLGRNDQINLYDAGGNLVDQLAYGDQTYPGTVRTQNKSCNIPATDYGYTVVQTSWGLAAVGDVYGSWASTGGDIGSPGIAPIPEPAALTLLACGLLLARRR